MPVRHETTRLSSKGQVLLPSSIRHARHWQAGMGFSVEETPEGVLLRPLAADTREHTRIEDVAGCLKSRREHVVSLEEMEAGVVAEALTQQDINRLIDAPVEWPVHVGQGGLAGGLDGLSNQALYAAAEHDA